MVNLTQKLSQFIAQTSFEDLPPEVVKEAKRRMADVIGIGLSGAKTEVGRQITSFVEKSELSGDYCSIWGQEGKSGIWGASLINATKVFHMEMDDVHRTSHTHPGVSTIPAVLAAAEKIGASGRDILTAIVVGYDIGIRIGNVVSPSIYVDKAFMAPGTLSAFSAASALANLYGCDEGKALQIIGNTSFLTPVAIFESYTQGTSIKETIMGWGSLVGAVASELTDYHFYGAGTALEGEFGFAEVAADTYNLERGIEGLGQVYEIMNTGIKPYACCRQHHAAIDCALALREEPGFDVSAIDRIVDRTFMVASRGKEKRPTTIGGAKYSAPFIIAVALLEGQVWRDQFSMEKIQDPSIQELASRVEVVFDKELDLLYDDKWPSIVEIYRKDGSKVEHRKDIPKGEPEFPVSDDELFSKFLDLALDTVSRSDAEEIWDLLFQLDTLDAISPLIEKL